MSKTNENLFDTQKKEAELKLMLASILDEFDDKLSSALNDAVMSLTDKEIIEIIVASKSVLEKKSEVMKTFLKALCKKSPNLKKQVQNCYGREFLIKNEIL